METPTRLSAAAAAAAAAMLAACATPYKPESAFNGGGFSEQRRAPGVYQVWFSGNVYTDQDRTEELALLRAAELCLGESKPFMRASDFKSGSALIGYRPGGPVTGLKPSIPTADNPNAVPMPGTVGYDTGRPLYTNRSGLKVECLAEKADDAQESVAVASTIRERYGLRTR